jgi:hypothetical protein
MPPRLRFLVVVAALLAAVCMVRWFGGGHVAAPKAGSGAHARSGRGHGAADGAPTHAAGAATVEDPATGNEPAREALVLEPRSLHGIVVDEAGQPVAEATLSTVGDYMEEPLVTTGVDGRFAIERRAEDSASHVQLFARHEQLDRAREWVAWGRDDVRLVLRPRVPVEVRVVDERGEPVPLASVTCESGPSSDQQLVEFAPNGDAWCGNACRGQNHLSIQYPEGAVVTHEELHLWSISISDPGPVQFRFVAATLLPREVRVVDPDGAPVADAKVEVIDARGGTVTAWQRTVGAYQRLGPALLAEAKTDASGTARPQLPRGRPLVVRAKRVGFAPGLVADVRVPGTEPVVVRLGRGANGRGRVLADPYLAERIASGGCELFFSQPSGRWWPQLGPESRHGLAVADDGSFVFAGAPPGQWDVVLTRPEQQSAGGSVQTSARAGQSSNWSFEACGVSVSLGDGDNPLLIVDLRTWQWTQVNLQVFVDEKAVRDEHVALWPVGGASNIRNGTRCDANGRCSVWLRPGAYWLDVAPLLSPCPTVRLDVAGDRLDRELHLATGEMVVTLVDGDGLPVRGLRCSAVQATETDAFSIWTPADGDGVFRGRCLAGEWAVFAPSREWENGWQGLDLSGDDALLQMAHARRLLGTVTVRAGETTKATFVVPDDVPR